MIHSKIIWDIVNILNILNIINITNIANIDNIRNIGNISNSRLSCDYSDYFRHVWSEGFSVTVALKRFDFH